MEITPDHLVLFRWGLLHLNATIAYTWIVMLLLVLGGWIATHRIGARGPRTRWEQALEAVVAGIRSQIREVSGQRGGCEEYIPF
ncbi:MAG TPA: hypothetical protein VJ732_03830, partial [Bryobacteraceae bacterium]|nr:hypothetical protein [Bryobacteraceae bacterium]